MPNIAHMVPLDRMLAPRRVASEATRARLLAAADALPVPGCSRRDAAPGRRDTSARTTRTSRSPSTPRTANVQRHPITSDQERGQRRRDRSAHARSHPAHAVGARPLVRRKPAGQGAGDASGRPRLPRRRTQKRVTSSTEIVPGDAGEAGKDRPSRHDPGEDFPLPDAVAEPSGRQFEDRIAEGENAEHVAHLDVREMQIARDPRRRRGKADPIQIRDQGHQERQHEYPGTSSGWCAGRSGGQG